MTKQTSVASRGGRVAKAKAGSGSASAVKSPPAKKAAVKKAPTKSTTKNGANGGAKKKATAKKSATAGAARQAQKSASTKTASARSGSAKSGSATSRAARGRAGGTKGAVSEGDMFLGLSKNLTERLGELRQMLDGTDGPDRGRILSEVGRVTLCLDGFDDALTAFADAEAALDAGSVEHRRARVKLALVRILRNARGDLADAKKALEAAAKEAEAVRDDDPEFAIIVDHYRGLLAFRRGERDEARRLLLRAVKGARAVGSLREEALALDSLSDYYRHCGEAGRSEAYLFKALELKRRLKDEYGQAVTLGLLGRLCLEFERYPKAQHYFEENLSLSREIGDSGRVARAMRYLGRSMVGQGKLDQADKRLKMGLMFAKRLAGGAVEADILKELAEVARRSGRMVEARKRLDNASQNYVKAKLPKGAAITDCMRAYIHFEEGDPRSAYTILKTATKTLKRHGEPTDLVPALGLMAQVQREVGERESAIEILKEASKVAREHHLFRELESMQRERYRLEQSRPDQGGDDSSVRFFREFCLYGMRGTVKEYKVLREIGAGTAGVVYEALDETLSRSVAIKMLKPELSRDSEQVARFRRELEAVGLVDHPAVMRIYAAGRNDDYFFYVTDFLPGPTLADVIDDGLRPYAELKPWLTRIAEAVAAVHHAEVVHRDLKPNNILLDRSREPVVVDFGISAKRGRVPAAEQGAVMGTFLYMPLEAMQQNATPTYEWDVFSLGVTFYELLSGRMPFPAKSFPELVQKLEAGKVAPLRCADKPPTALRTLITDMLAKDPTERPTALEVVDRLAGI